MATNKEAVQRNCSPIASGAARKGKVLLKKLVRSLQNRGVPVTSYVMAH